MRKISKKYAAENKSSLEIALTRLHIMTHGISESDFYFFLKIVNSLLTLVGCPELLPAKAPFSNFPQC